jgi:hypothetical protein
MSHETSPQRRLSLAATFYEASSMSLLSIELFIAYIYFFGIT